MPADYDATIGIGSIENEELRELIEAVRLHEDMREKSAFAEIVSEGRRLFAHLYHTFHVRLNEWFRRGDVQFAKWFAPTGVANEGWFVSPPTEGGAVGSGNPILSYPLGSTPAERNENVSEEIEIVSGLKVHVSEDSIVVEKGQIKIGENIIEIEEQVFERPPFPVKVIVTKDGIVMTCLDAQGSVMVLAEVNPP